MNNEVEGKDEIATAASGDAGIPSSGAGDAIDDGVSALTN